MVVENPTLMTTNHCVAGLVNSPPIKISEGNYVVQFARTDEELDALFRLRFDVFNLELGEGLAESLQSGRDQDAFDATCHHLIVIDTAQDEIIGTYRMQTCEMAATGPGFYSAGEFDFSYLPNDVLEQGVELGRACIARPHRTRQVLFLLWKGLVNYAVYQQKRYLFGCSSITSQDPCEGKRLLDVLKQKNYIHPHVYVVPRDEFVCITDDMVCDNHDDVSIPTLFKMYLLHGAKVCGLPAIDRQFKTIDFLVLFDLESMDRRMRRFFLSEH